MARLRKQVSEGEQDEEPTYVVEDSQDTLSKAEFEALISTNDDDDKQKENTKPLCTKISRGIEGAEAKRDGVTGEAALVKQQVASIGCSTKRKLAKIVGDEEEQEQEQERAAALRKNDSRKLDTKRRAKKGKKMKLSFDEGTEA